MRRLGKFSAVAMTMALVFSSISVSTVSAKTEYKISKSVRITYDEEGNKEDTEVSKFTYNKKGNVTKYVSESNECKEVTTYKYYKNGSMKSYEQTRSYDTGTYYYIYKYDKKGNTTYEENSYVSEEYGYANKSITKIKNTYSGKKLKKVVRNGAEYDKSETDDDFSLTHKVNSTVTYKYKGKNVISSKYSGKGYIDIEGNGNFVLSSVDESTTKYKYKNKKIKKCIYETSSTYYDNYAESDSSMTYNYKTIDYFDKYQNCYKSIGYSNGELFIKNFTKYKKKNIVSQEHNSYSEGKKTYYEKTLYYKSGKYKGLAKSNLVKEDGETTKTTYKYKLDNNKNVKTKKEYVNKKLRSVEKNTYKKFK